MFSPKSMLIFGIFPIIGSFSLLVPTAKAEITIVRESQHSHPITEIAGASKKPITTKTETIYIEGEPQKVTLYQYDKSGVPFTTYIPDDVNVESDCNKEGCSYLFEFTELVDPQLQIFIPDKTTTVANLEAMTQELIQSNGWEIQGEYSDAETMTYPWVKKEIVFMSQSNDTIGIILLGEANNQPIRIVESFPGEFGDGFTPLADVIIQNLQFR